MMVKFPPKLTVANPVPGLNSKFTGTVSSMDLGLIPEAEKSSLTDSLMVIFPKG